MAYTLKINGERVYPPKAAGPRVTLDTFSRDYEGPSTLQITVQGVWQSPPYVPDSVVELWRDKTLIFDGLLQLPRPSLNLSMGPSIIYQAVDRSFAADMRPIVAVDGTPTIGNLPQGPLDVLIAKLCETIGSGLAQLGIVHPCEYAGGAGSLESGASGVSGSLDGGIRQLAAGAHGAKVLLSCDGTNRKYRLINAMASPVFDVVLDVQRVLEWALEPKIDGRAGAVALMPQRVQGRMGGVLACNLVPAWDRELESQWTLGHAFTAAGEDGAEDPLSAVFRKWSFKKHGEQVGKEAELTAMIEGRAFLPRRWKVVEIASVDWDERTLMLKLPGIEALANGVAGRMNPNIAGKAAAADARLRYTVNKDAPIDLPLVRIPASGFGGEAYQACPITCANELRITSPGGVDREKFCKQAFDVYSKPVAQGTVTLLGDCPEELWWLDRRISFKTAKFGATGYEHLQAPLLGIKVEFAGGGKTTLDFSTDRKDLMQGKPS